MLFWRHFESSSLRSRPDFEQLDAAQYRMARAHNITYAHDALHYLGDSQPYWVLRPITIYFCVEKNLVLKSL